MKRYSEEEKGMWVEDWRGSGKCQKGDPMYNSTNNQCCVCRLETDTVYELAFKEVYGMAHDYVQKINICPKCGFIYTANPFSEEQLANRYKNMSKYEFDVADEIIEGNSEYKKRCYRQYYFIRNTLENIHSIIEIGCASGYNLNLYKKDEVEVYGIEPSANNVISCKKNYGIDLFQGTFKEYINHGDNKYDLVFLSHVLEHIINPYQFLVELSKINNKYMFIEVPSLDFKFRDEPFGMFAEEHVNIFTLDNLRNMMKSVGYNIIDANLYFSSGNDIPAGYPCISTIWTKENLYKKSLTSKRSPIISSNELLEKYLDNSKKEQERINNIIESIDDKINLAVWGTGHHTSRLLGISNLGKKSIIKFYDSDERKRNVIFYNKNITPFDPNDIKSKIVDTILISSYVAQEAIKNMIEKCGVKCNYITLY